MVRIVHALSEQGLVKAKPDKRDRRKVVISDTERGRELMLRARQRRVRALAELIAGINPSEQEQLRVAVEVLRDLLNEQRNPPLIQKGSKA